MHDRDINAAKNLNQEAVRILTTQTAGYAGLACGDGGADMDGRLIVNVKPLSVKQESNNTFS